MNTVLYISVVVLLSSFCIFVCIACWALFEETEVGQMFIERLKKKKEDRKEEC